MSDDNSTVHAFNALGAPKGHVRCKLHILEVRRDFTCECGEEFTHRIDLEAHHRTVATLLAGVLS